MEGVKECRMSIWVLDLLFKCKLLVIDVGEEEKSVLEIVQIVVERGFPKLQRPCKLTLKKA